MKLEVLKQELSKLPAGPITNRDIERMLAEAWDELKGDYGGMKGRKLLGRMEAAAWNEPLLTFDIERHGATVNGSIYAHVQSWSVDLSTSTATLVREKRRQVGKRDSRLDVRFLAEDLGRTILHGDRHEDLSWRSDRSVKVDIASVIPATNQQTTSSRRKRFWSHLTEQMKPHGWERRNPRSAFMEKVESGI